MTGSAGAGGGHTALIARHAEALTARRRRRRRLVLGLRAALLVLLVGLWALAGSRSDYWRSIVQTPAAVGDVLGSWLTDPAWWDDVLVTLQEAALGYVLGVALALLLVAAIVPVPWIDRLLSPFVAGMNALPKLLLFPLFIVWFGLGTSGKVYFIATVIFPVVFYGLHAGIKSIDRALLDHARMLGGSTRQLLTTVYLPAVATWLIVSMRISVSVALLGAVIGEYLGAFDGIGQRIAEGRSAFRPDVVLAGVVFVAVVAGAIDRVMVRVQRRYSAWSVF